jgi:uncharacterized protein
MTSFLVDINVWLALSWGLHRHSTPAHGWLTSLRRDQTRLLFCRITQLGLLRLLTNKMVMGGSVLTVAQALGALDRWGEDPRVEFAAEPPGLEASFRRMLQPLGRQSATKSLMDVYLAAFASASRVTLVTLDSALGRIARNNRVAWTLLKAPIRSESTVWQQRSLE